MAAFKPDTGTRQNPVPGRVRRGFLERFGTFLPVDPSPTGKRHKVGNRFVDNPIPGSRFRGFPPTIQLPAAGDTPRCVCTSTAGPSHPPVPRTPGPDPTGSDADERPGRTPPGRRGATPTRERGLRNGGHETTGACPGRSTRGAAEPGKVIRATEVARSSHPQGELSQHSSEQ